MYGQFYDFAMKPLETMGLRKLRSELLSHAHGKTLEIGIGTGLSLPYYPSDANVIGIEPDEKMKSKADKRAMTFHAQVEIGDAQNLPFPDDEFDTVVGTLVFCTIPDPDKAIDEVYRVLKPGGTFLVLEHVRKNTPIAGKFLDIVTPAWSVVAGGCHLNRDPSAHLKAVGFKTEKLKVLWNGLLKVWTLRK